MPKQLNIMGEGGSMMWPKRSESSIFSMLLPQHKSVLKWMSASCLPFSFWPWFLLHTILLSSHDIIANIEIIHITITKSGVLEIYAQKRGLPFLGIITNVTLHNMEKPILCL